MGFFSFVNRAFGGEQSQNKQTIKLPWNDYEKQAKELQVKGKIDEVLKVEILEISQSAENFEVFRKGQNSGIYEFDIDDYVDVAMILLDVDVNLAVMYSKLVPTRLNEESFWKSYFYTIEQVKTKTMQKFSSLPPAPVQVASHAHDALIGELDQELEDNDTVLQSLPNEVKGLKGLLITALNRIEELEKRVIEIETELKAEKEKQKEQFEPIKSKEIRQDISEPEKPLAEEQEIKNVEEIQEPEKLAQEEQQINNLEDIQEPEKLGKEDQLLENEDEIQEPEKPLEEEQQISNEEKSLEDQKEADQDPEEIQTDLDIQNPEEEHKV